MTNTNGSIEILKSPDDVWAPSFKIGWAAGRNWSAGDLRSIERNFRLLNARGHMVAPITAGHQERPILAGYNDSAQPALGLVSDAEVRGDRLWLRMSKVPSYARSLAKNGRMLSVSCEIVPQIQNTSFARRLGEAAAGASGAALVGLAWLGGQRGEVLDLPSLAQLYAKETADDDGVLRIAYGTDDDARPYLASERTSRERDVRITLAERVTAMETTMTRIAETNQQMMATLKAAEDQNAYEARVAPPAVSEPSEPNDSAIAELFRLAVAETVAAMGLDGSEPSDLLKAARATLVSWQNLKPSPQATVSGARSLAQQVTPTMFQRAVTIAPEFPPSAIPDQIDVDGRGRARVVSANYPGITPASPLRVSRLSERDTPPVYGAGATESARLGGDDRYWRLREIAKVNRLSLARPADRKQAEALLFRELGSSDVRGAATFAEAHAAAMRRLGVKPGQLQFAETAEREAEAARIVAAEAKHTLGREYGSRGNSRAEDPTDVRFNAEVRRRLREQDVPPSPENIRRVTQHLMATRPETIPTNYGRGTK